MADEPADIGVIGLGVMGSNLALNMAEKGHRVAVYNRTASRTDELMAEAGALSANLVPVQSLSDLVAAIKPPRPVLLMIKAGEPVDGQIKALLPLIGDNGIIIDGGNANYRDTSRRLKDLDGSGVGYIGLGVSGGEEGARHGPSLMAGGSLEAWERIAPVMRSIAARFEGDPCAARVGPGASGHFVKTIHNGIEYADMQMIAEIYGLMRDGLALKPDEMAGIVSGWREGPLDSYLIDITADVLRTLDPKTGQPIVDVIADSAGQKGTGRWAAIEALDLGSPASVIEAAVGARNISAQKVARIAAGERFSKIRPAGAYERSGIIADLEQALIAGKIIAYAQGFSVMAAASSAHDWAIDLPVVARIWRAGCIIRSRFLDGIAAALTNGEPEGGLVMTAEFSAMIETAQGALRRVVAGAALAGLPVPALSAALAHFDMLRQARGTANLLQAQRDFFGAHGFARIDRDGVHHGPWGADA